jgi:hypothetical protein
VIPGKGGEDRRRLEHRKWIKSLHKKEKRVTRVVVKSFNRTSSC